MKALFYGVFIILIAISPITIIIADIVIEFFDNTSIDDVITKIKGKRKVK